MREEGGKRARQQQNRRTTEYEEKCTHTQAHTSMGTRITRLGCCSQYLNNNKPAALHAHDHGIHNQGHSATHTSTFAPHVREILLLFHESTSLLQHHFLLGRGAVSSRKTWNKTASYVASQRAARDENTNSAMQSTTKQHDKPKFDRNNDFACENAH